MDSASIQPTPQAASSRDARARVRGIESISADDRSAMFELYSRHYADCSPGIFARDLSRKTHVVWLAAADARLIGFSTLEVSLHETPWGLTRTLFSGDTIIDPEHWGSQALAFEWIRFAGEVQRAAPHVPLYWLLIVKGHRTYRYLKTFALQYVPRADEGAAAALRPLRDFLAQERFGKAYDAPRGIVHFDVPQGRLVPSLAQIDERHLRLREVAFFVASNPRYAAGDELVCLCELAEHNLRPLAQRVFAGRA